MSLGLGLAGREAHDPAGLEAAEESVTRPPPPAEVGGWCSPCPCASPPPHPPAEGEGGGNLSPNILALISSVAAVAGTLLADGLAMSGGGSAQGRCGPLLAIPLWPGPRVIRRINSSVRHMGEGEGVGLVRMRGRLRGRGRKPVSVLSSFPLPCIWRRGRCPLPSFFSAPRGQTLVTPRGGLPSNKTSVQCPPSLPSSFFLPSFLLLSALSLVCGLLLLAAAGLLLLPPFSPLPDFFLQKSTKYSIGKEP